jgi:Na+-driven multidrug efflux pump
MRQVLTRLGLGYGAKGVAIASSLSDTLALSLYLYTLSKQRLLFSPKPSLSLVFSLSSWREQLGKLERSWRENILPMLKNALSMQLRSIALHIAILSIAKTIHALDTQSGVAAAAHSLALNLYLLGSVPAMTFNMVSTVIVPKELAKAKALIESDRETETVTETETETQKAFYRVRSVANRLIFWGGLLGLLLSVTHASLAQRFIQSVTPLQSVQDAAKSPALIGALLQVINALVFVFEGIQQGTQSYLPIAIATALGTLLMLIGLKGYVYFGGEHTVGTVWGCYVILAVVRLMGAALYHYVTGPLAPRMIKKQSESHIKRE